MTDIKIGPPELLRIVRLGGKGPCGAKCGCRKASAIKPESKQNDYQKSFPDAFKLYYIYDTAVIFVYCYCHVTVMFKKQPLCRCSGKKVFLKIAVLKVVR